MTFQQQVNLGKNGLTEEFLEDLKNRFDSKVGNIKVCVLKSARESGREDVREYSKRIEDYLGDNYTCRVVGFSIFIKKWRKPRR
jgi:RNA-binding protein YhbY